MPRPSQKSKSQGASTGDLRGGSMDQKRDRDSKHKWEPKWAALGIPATKAGPNGTVRPRRVRLQQYGPTQRQQNHEREVRMRNRPIVSGFNDIHAAAEYSSAEEDAYYASADATAVAPAEVVDVKYSFDAPKGPSHGSEILEMALAKAVEKYEDKQTRKLVHDEYEVLDSVSELGDPQSADALEDDDGFELI